MTATPDQPPRLSLREKTSRAVARLRARSESALQWLRFGTVTETVTAVDGGVPSEIEFRGRFGRLVGFWAYGSFDPSLPYRC